MNQSIHAPWPPSLEALGPPPDDASDPHDPIGVMRRQHRELVPILRGLAQAVDRPAPDLKNEVRLRRRVRDGLGELNHFLENHRDIEESHIFPYLLAGRAEIESALDDLGDEHIQIFEEMRQLNILMDRLDTERRPGDRGFSALLPVLRDFLERLWRHTLTEEALLRDWQERAP